MPSPLPVRRPATSRFVAALLLFASVATTGCAGAQVPSTDLVIDAHEAWRKKDAALLAPLRQRALAQQHPLASWVDYWELGSRLAQAEPAEVEAFYARWSGTYVEDRLRNDWLLELGKRRDWVRIVRDFPRFRMNDDREVTCYALLGEYMVARAAGQALAVDFKPRAVDAWLAQRDLDDGCHLLATTLVETRLFTPDDVWLKVRFATETNRAAAARAAAALAAPALQAQVAQALENPALYLAAGATLATRAHAEVATLALIRIAANDPDVAATQLRARWQALLPKDLLAWAWAQAGRNAALKLAPEALDYYRNAWSAAERGNVPPAWSDETLAWNVRAALRSNNGVERWRDALRAIAHLSESEQRDPAWRYWRARAQRESADAGTAAGLRDLAQAQAALQQLASELHFYGKLAAEDLGAAMALPPRPAALTPDEIAAARAHPGLSRALQLIGLGLRGEGVREWNFSLRGMNDRALLAAAERACENEVWDRCINTSDRTRGEVDLAQRFPMPYRRAVVAQCNEIGLDPAYVYGLIRQESRFVTDARSHVGAAGLMQVMPATARWTAKKIGLPFTPAMIADRDLNLKLGTHYLKLILDDFDGSQVLATAAYNAGPNRPRRWREGARLEPAVWAENIPFAETRDYVKKVLSNATVYAALLAGRVQVAESPPVSASAASAAPAKPAVAQAFLPSLKSRLGSLIGPRDVAALPSNPELP
jgi:soluble lytic murein transglycosylase